MKPFNENVDSKLAYFRRLMTYLVRFYFLISFALLYGPLHAQTLIGDSSTKTVVAEASFKKESRFYQWLWGHNRRTEWATPVHVPYLWLDNIHGGLEPYARGGGNESKSLRLKSRSGKEYALRSILKSRNDVIPTDFKNTFVAHLINDGISCSYPYGAFALAEMQEAAGIYHAVPKLFYVPHQAALDTFDEKFGDDLYLLEQRPEGDWSDAANLGSFQEFVATDKLIKKIQKDHRKKADQHAFVKARLFDMLIGDWDRHEDNWRWGFRDSADHTIYTAIPRDRDQVFFTHDGFLLDRFLPAAGLSFMQNFDSRVQNIASLNIEERYMDRFFTNELGLDDWLLAARTLEQALTDVVIEKSIRQLPPEVFAVSGNELIEKLKSRRAQLVDFARTYYLFIAKQVEVVGSQQSEYFDLKEMDSGEMLVDVFGMNENGKRQDQSFFHRIFKPEETKEIRLFGISGEDVFRIAGKSSAIRIRIIGGPERDSIIQTGGKISIYDNGDNIFQTTSARMHISPDSAIHVYDYESFEYDSKGFSPDPFYNYEDRIYIGFNYGITKHKWRRKPLASRHSIGINYSISQNSISASLTTLYPNLIGHWDLFFRANFDAVRWTNFYGFGNETVADTKRVEFYRMHSREWLVTAGLRRVFGRSAIDLATFYRRVKINSDTDRHVAKFFPPSNTSVFESNHYGGVRFTYTYALVNDSIVPTRGFTFYGNAVLANNFTSRHFFQNYSARLQTYWRLGPKFSLAIKAGGSTIGGDEGLLANAQVYQHAVIGGPESLRGYRRERFWGKTSYYNNNEFRFITNLRSYLLNAKIGLLAFFDDGRVWIPNETSSTIHTSYGGGILLAPFNQICFTLTYGISDELRLFQFRINSLF